METERRTPFDAQDAEEGIGRFVAGEIMDEDYYRTQIPAELRPLVGDMMVSAFLEGIDMARAAKSQQAHVAEVPDGGVPDNVIQVDFVRGSRI